MILILGGTREARDLGHRLAAEGISGIISLSGATNSPAPQGLPVRSGSFGGPGPMADFIRKNGISAVIDATHPFARQMTQRSFALCADLGLPMVRLERPAWRPVAGDRWTHVQHPEEVAGHLSATDRVLALTGPRTARTLGLSGYNVLCRRIDPPAADDRPPAGWRWHVAPPPYDVKTDMDLMVRERITAAVMKNAGGEGAVAKVEAARALSLHVVMIARAPLPDGLHTVATVTEAAALAARGCAP